MPTCAALRRADAVTFARIERLVRCPVGIPCMRIPRLTVVTLGVSDLAKATAFYREIFSIAPNTKYEGVPFIELPRAWLSPCPLEKPAEDISPTLSAACANVANRHGTCSGMGSAVTSRIPMVTAGKSLRGRCSILPRTVRCASSREFRDPSRRWEPGQSAGMDCVSSGRCGSGTDLHRMQAPPFCKIDFRWSKLVSGPVSG